MKRFFSQLELTYLENMKQSALFCRTNDQMPTRRKYRERYCFTDFTASTVDFGYRDALN